MGVNDPQLWSKDEVPTRNFFVPLRSTEMEADHGNDVDDSTKGQQQQALSSQAGRLPPIILTSQVSLIQLQRQLKDLLKGSFEFRSSSSSNRTRIVMKEVADFSAIYPHFKGNNLPYFTFCPKSRTFHSPLLQRISQMGWWTLALTLLASNGSHPSITYRGTST
jgi:hypothetical protein